jgi:hypothetical protein
MMFSKIGLRVVSGISFLSSLIVGALSIPFGMVMYAPPEVMQENRHSSPGAFLFIAALILFFISIITLIISFFRKSE